MARIIPEELDILIQEYLTDGVITERERKVLLNKAAALNLNIEEVDLYIDAQQQKVRQSIDNKIAKQRGTKCPHCGQYVEALSDRCPACSNPMSATSSTELVEIIESLENALVDMKANRQFAQSKATVEKNLRKAELYYSSNPKVKILIEKVNAEIAIAEKNKRKSDRKAFFNKYEDEIQIVAIMFGMFLLSIMGFILTRYIK